MLDVRCSAVATSSQGATKTILELLLAQFFDVNISKLQEARRAVPFALPLAAVVLQADPPARRQARDLCAGNHGFAIQHHSDGVAAHGDFKMVPLAYRLVRLRARRSRVPQFRR